MKEAKEHEREAERLEELESYSILDTISEEDFDNLTAIASEICNTPIALISLLDSKRQWFKSHHGLPVSETPKEFAFCAHAINDQDNVFIVQDSRVDERFHDNPLVTGDPNVIFYAGVPLVGTQGLPLGTLCVIDNKPRLLSKRQVKSLEALSKQVMNLLELRKNKRQLEQSLIRLDEKNGELEKFAYIAAHDIKSPLNNISSLTGLLLKSQASNLDDDGKMMLDLIGTSSARLKRLVDGLLEYSKNENIIKESKTEIILEELIRDISGLFTHDYSCTISLDSELTTILMNRAAIEQVLMNLVSNSIKYNDTEQVDIQIGVSEDDLKYHIYVQDNGPGIDPEHHAKIFTIFQVIGKDKSGEPGNGIGLATARKIIESLGGKIEVESEIGKGAKFNFSIKKL